MPRGLRLSALISIIIAMGILAGCTPNVVGKYSDADGIMKVELNPGGKAHVTTFLRQGGECTYEVKRKTVYLTCNGMTTPFAVHDDGSLGPIAGGIAPELKKLK